jgi:uncharacterized membrane protein YeaQ/YmgE (transglycosylase-associated protein family)
MGNGYGLIASLFIGALAGWLAGKITQGRGFGALGNILIGIVGAGVGGFLFGLLGITTYNLVGTILMATVGAIVLLYVVGLITRKT